MGFWSKLFGQRTSAAGDERAGQAAEAPAPGSPAADAELEEKLAAVATLLLYKSQGSLRVVRDESGQLTGFWLARLPDAGSLPTLLQMAAVSEKADQATYISIRLGDYRMVEGEGGHFVMVGGARAPGERIPALASAAWRSGERNPASKRVDRMTEGVQGVRYLCPTCELPTYCYDREIADHVGAMVQCAHCKNISHVPAAARGARSSSGLEIRACAFVPVAELPDWLMAHPSCKDGDPEHWSSYGLWAYCADCSHQYASSVLFPFTIAKHSAGMLFNANSAASAADMQGLRAGGCPQCGGPSLLALLVDVPEAVRARLAELRGG